MKKYLATGLVLLGLSMPVLVDAKGMGVSSRPSVRISTPRMSTPKISTPKPSTLKSGSSTLKPTSNSKLPRVSKSDNSSVKSTESNNTVSRGSSSKVTSGNYSVKPKTIDTTNNQVPSSLTDKSKNEPSYYSGYSRQPLNYSRGLGFWDYYMLSSLMNSNSNPSERDIAKELEDKGYTKEETDKILNDAKKEQSDKILNDAKKEQSDNKQNKEIKIFKIAFIALAFVGLAILIERKKG